MRFFNSKVLSMALLTLVMGLGACAQGRKSYSQGKEVIFEKQKLCANSQGDALGCFDIEVHYTTNMAYLDVVSLNNTDNVTGQAVPYRVLARRANDSEFSLLVSSASAGAGQYLEITPSQGHYIEEYVEWRIELIKNFATSNTGTKLGLENADPGQGLPIVQTYVSYPEVTAAQ